MWYNNTKYSKWYFSIIENAKANLYDDVYTEIHHIIPKSLNGSDDVDNLIRISYREHFILHRLLPKMVTSIDDQRKMNYALSMMRRRNNLVKLNSRYFNIMKIAAKKANLGKMLSDDTKDKLRKMRIEQMSDDIFISKWKESLKKRPPQDKKTIEKRTETQKNTLMETRGVTNVSQLPEVKEKVSAKLKNRVFTEEHKEKISKSKKGKSNKNNPMFTEEGRKKLSESKIGMIMLHKEDKRKLAKPNSEKWNQLVLDGWTPINTSVESSGT